MIVPAGPRRRAARRCVWTACPARPPTSTSATPLATGLHLVDSPVFDRDGNLYVTFSGSRGQQAPISIFVVRPDGTREPFAADVPNPTSMAFDRDGRALRLVAVRRQRVPHRRPTEPTSIYATDLGVACGIAFGPDDALYVGDRSGSILRVDGRARDAGREHAGERRRLSSRVRPRRLPLRHGADAGGARSGLPRLAGRRGRGVPRRLRPAAGAGVRRPAAVCTSSSASPAGAASIGCRSIGRRAAAAGHRRRRSDRPGVRSARRPRARSRRTPPTV